MRLKQKHKDLLAVLFACGDPIDLPRLSQALDVDTGGLDALVDELAAALRAGGWPLEVLRLSKSVQLCTCPKYDGVIREALSIKRNAPLSQAAFEVLAVVAYNQPVTKSFVEQVRGVDSSSVVNSLVEKGLLEEAGRLELPGRPLAYRTTANFLRCFSMRSLDDLPNMAQEEPAPGETGEALRQDGRTP